MTLSTDSRFELSRLREQHEAARLKLEIRQLQAAAGLPLFEEWGDVVDRREALCDDGLNGPVWPAPAATLDDRRDGRMRPVYDTEDDLARIRGAARQLASVSTVSVGALDALANYTLGSGFTFTAHSDFEQPRLVTAAQRVIDEFLDDNEFCGLFDREAHHRSREDGEAFIWIQLDERSRIRARFLEPEQIVEPASPAPIEHWLGLDQKTSSWRFGVHSELSTPDVPWGYHTVFDGAGRDWDYLPTKYVEHIKRNVPRNAKRGVSDFHAMQGDIEREAKLRRNSAEGAALQAAIAWIVHTPAGAKAPGASNAIARRRDVLTYPPGTILRPSPGMEYRPGPMGSERNANFVLLGQYVLRSIGVRWNMPEYLISGDAGNANYASTLVAESPFVKAREADQQFYRQHFHSLIWKVLYLAWEQGRFQRLGLDWPEVEEFLDIKIDVPAVATRDPLKLVQMQEAQIRLGLLSRPTAAAQAGLNYELEQAQGAGAPAAPPSSPPVAPGGSARPKEHRTSAGDTP